MATTIQKMKIPDDAKKVFKGEIFDVYQWPQKMFDGSTATFEAIKRPDTVEVIAVKDDKIILGIEKQPTKPAHPNLFGGRQEPGEGTLETAKRELLEESGLESDDWELIRTYEPVHKMDWKIHLFVARNCKKTADQDLDPGEKIEIKEVSFDEFINIVTSCDFWGVALANDVYRAKAEDRLDQFKKKLFP